MRGLVILFLALGFLSLTAHAQDQLATDLSDDEIAITSSFTGKELLLFGTSGENGIDLSAEGAEGVDVIVVVHGPEVPMRIWRKERVAGVWVNSQPVTFENVPGYYAVASNRPLEDITTADYLRSENIGTENLVLISVEDVPVEEKVELRKAIMGNRTDAGLFIKDESAVTFPAGPLFRSAIHFPANVPVGDYRVIVRLFVDGVEIDRTYSVIAAGKKGLEQRIYEFAQNQSLFYGVVAVLLAVLAGWVASVVFRRA